MDQDLSKTRMKAREHALMYVAQVSSKLSKPDTGSFYSCFVFNKRQMPFIGLLPIQKKIKRNQFFFSLITLWHF